MDPEDADPAPEARPPLLEDLVCLCRNLNREGALEHAEASEMTVEVEIDGVRIPFANARLLWRTKDTYRDKDKVDRAFLAQLLAGRGETVE